MVSLDTIRAEFKARLADKPRGLPVDEQMEVLHMLIGEISDEERCLFIRLNIWRKQPKLSEKVVCANIELVRFGVLSARPMRDTKDQNSDAQRRPSSSARISDIARFFKTHRIESMVINRRSDTVEDRAAVLDACVEQSMISNTIVVPDQEEITADANKGNNRTQSMHYISVQDLTLCISRSENASVLRDYAMNVMMAMELYNDEWHLAKDNALDQKDDKMVEMDKKIDYLTETNQELIELTKTQSNQITQQTTMITHQSNDIQQLLEYGRETRDDLHYIKNFLFDFAKATLTAWNGSSVIKTQLNNLIRNYSIQVALTRLKFAYVLGFVRDNRLIVYFCCTNFKNVGDRIRTLNGGHSLMTMLQPQAICLITSEINWILAIVRRTDFKNISDITTTKNGMTKSFDIKLGNPSAANSIYDTIVKDFRSKRMQMYQARMDEMDGNGSINLDVKVLTQLRTTDDIFFTAALPFCQDYLNCYVAIKKNNKLGYIVSSRTTTIRPDIQNQKLNDRIYALYKIKQLLDEDAGVDVFDEMVRTGIITRENKKDLVKIAKVEKLKIPDMSDTDSDTE